MSGPDKQTIVWQFCDGKAGHERQSTGLVNALMAKLAIGAYRIRTTDVRVSALHILRRKFPHAEALPNPDLILGAGRACQIPMLLAQRARGGYTVYLMKPVLPSSLFDLCLIPRHDGVKAHSRIIVTDGVLNDIVASDSAKQQGLVLIGGPSKHYGWDSAHLLRQIREIIADSPTKKWFISDSRRTPDATAETLDQLASSNVSIIHHDGSTSGWLQEQFVKADSIWVTRDSMSMLFESLSCGAGVGVLDVPIKRKSRVTVVADDLAARGMVTPFTRWNGGPPPPNETPLAEAARCAELIVAHWFGTVPTPRRPEGS